MSPAMPIAEEQARSQSVGRETLTPEGRLRVEGLSETERNFAVATHLSTLGLLGFVAVGPLAIAVPLVLWLIRKDQSAFNDDHGREAVNFSISYLIWGFITVWTVIIPIVLTIVGVINLIRASLAASRGEYFRYPMTIRFLK
jgi:uncharacterized protein